MPSKFVQIHMLTSYPATLLNRDEAGFAKRIPIGGAMRTRISSQCMKRHWRTFAGEGGLHEIGVPLAIRSRISFQVRVYKPLLDDGVPEENARLIADGLQALVLGSKSEAEKAPKPAKASKVTAVSDGDPVEATVEPEKAEEAPTTNGKVKPAGKTEQVTVLGVHEMDAILVKAREIVKATNTVTDVKNAIAALRDKKNKKWLDNFKAMPATLDSAMFGRMVTGDHMADSHAAMHVAHAFTVHAEQSEPDYFSAVDDLVRENGETSHGSGHVNTTELTSGLYYICVVIDVDLLRQNCTGLRSEKHAAGEAVAREILYRIPRIVATVTPGAKLGATAPYSWASMILVELGDAQPRQLANAFLKPVQTTNDDQGILHNAYDALASHVQDMDRMWGKKFDRAWSAVSATPLLTTVLGNDTRKTVDELQAFVAGAL